MRLEPLTTVRVTLADILDLGDVTASRGMEMYLPIWLRMWGAVGSPMFNVKVVR